ncbi:MAG TPA: hypothetical protein VFJ50_08220, partial [Gemmatimonadales bacterium]|nr:hypothetical protein [Gemmatimonadales bacterium]
MTTPETEPRPSEPRPPRRWLRRAGMAGVVLVAIVAGLVALLQLPPVATAVVRKLLTLAPFNPGNQLEVGHVTGNFLRGLTLEEIHLRQGSRELAYVRRLSVRYRLPSLRPPATRLDEMAIDGGRIAARRQGDTWDLADVLRKSTDTTSRGGGLVIGSLGVRDLAVTAELGPDSLARARVQELAIKDLVLGQVTQLKIDALRLAVQPPTSDRWLGLATRGAVTGDEIRLDPLRMFTETTDLSGRLVVPRRFDDARHVDRLDIRLLAQPLDLADLAGLMPAGPGTGLLRFDARANGEGDMVTAHLAAALDRGRLTLDGGTRLDRGKPTSVRLHGVISELDPAKVSASAPAGELNATVDADMRGALRTADGSAR